MEVLTWSSKTLHHEKQRLSFYTHAMEKKKQTKKHLDLNNKECVSILPITI